MAFEIPYGHPEKLAAGDTLKFYKALSDFSAADGWTLTYYIRGNGTGMAQSYSNVNDNGDYLISVSKRDTAEWTVGKYRFEGFVYKGGERYRVDYGEFQVTPDFQAGTAALDYRTDNQKALDAITATLKGTASIAEKQFQIGGKMIERFSPSELIKLKSYFDKECQKEQAAEDVALGKRSGKTIHVRLIDS